MSHEDGARAIHRAGRSCSVAVYEAFSNVDHAGGNSPAPRSIDGKCGALLAAEQVLHDLGVDAEGELDGAFERELGYVRCTELRRHRIDCNDCVGVAARLLDELLA